MSNEDIALTLMALVDNSERTIDLRSNGVTLNPQGLPVTILGEVSTVVTVRELMERVLSAQDIINKHELACGNCLRLIAKAMENPSDE